MDAQVIEEEGLLSRKGGGFVLASDRGGEFVLDLHRVPVDLVGKRVRLTGTRLVDGRIEVEGVRRA